MLEIGIFTLFPEMFTGVLGESILKRAIAQALVRVDLINFRDYATDKHKTVDDSPFGGGAGMVLKAEPLFDAVESTRRNLPPVPRERVILMSPQGRPFTQQVAEELATCDRLLMICGHYEGFDERVREHLVTDELSIGDYVLTGGELASMVVMDSVVRLLPGALGNHVSPDDDSFSTGLLEYPQYTRPAVFRGHEVPKALLSGNHREIAAWRRRHALYRTWKRRPDLLATVDLSEEDRRILSCFQAGDFTGIDVL